MGLRALLAEWRRSGEAMAPRPRRVLSDTEGTARVGRCTECSWFTDVDATHLAAEQHTRVTGHQVHASLTVTTTYVRDDK